MNDDPRQQRHCSTINCPDHMKGWEAFGIVKQGEPIVRRLGTGHHTPKPKFGTEPWGPGETHRGVHNIELMTFADSPGSAFIYVNGSTETATREAWERTSAAFLTIADALWRMS